MADFKVKLDRTDHIEERLRKAEESVEKLELSELGKYIENININESREDRQQIENESSINITKKNGQANLKLEGFQFIKDKDENYSTRNNRRSAHDNAAFSVFWSYCDGGNIALGDRETSPFDIVELNDGNGFDTSVHAFICPLTGTYFHHVDGITKAVLTTGNPHNENLECNQSALFHCRQNQRVMVMIWRGYGIGIQSDVGFFLFVFWIFIMGRHG
ncbi:hypothetical protein ACJMK2_007271 [Sinanodonta woodiana]|uniref:Uncharacterized protein n=1 Tax=Sinanodonta woodiana TaxID=1069815 RepID=A0ABD3VI94_SINWO